MEGYLMDGQTRAGPRATSGIGTTPRLTLTGPAPKTVTAPKTMTSPTVKIDQPTWTPTAPVVRGTGKVAADLVLIATGTKEQVLELLAGRAGTVKHAAEGDILPPGAAEWWNTNIQPTLNQAGDWAQTNVLDPAANWAVQQGYKTYLDKWKDTWEKTPELRYGLGAAGIGAGLGLGAGLIGRKKKTRALGDALTGGMMGAGLGALGGYLMRPTPPAPEQPPPKTFVENVRDVAGDTSQWAVRQPDLFGVPSVTKNERGDVTGFNPGMGVVPAVATGGAVNLAIARGLTNTEAAFRRAVGDEKLFKASGKLQDFVRRIAQANGEAAAVATEAGLSDYARRLAAGAVPMPKGGIPRFSPEIPFQPGSPPIAGIPHVPGSPPTPGTPPRIIIDPRTGVMHQVPATPPTPGTPTTAGVAPVPATPSVPGVPPKEIGRTPYGMTTLRGDRTVRGALQNIARQEKNPTFWYGQTGRWLPRVGGAAAAIGAIIADWRNRHPSHEQRWFEDTHPLGGVPFGMPLPVQRPPAP